MHDRVILFQVGRGKHLVVRVTVPNMRCGEGWCIKDSTLRHILGGLCTHQITVFNPFDAILYRMSDRPVSISMSCGLRGLYQRPPNSILPSSGMTNVNTTHKVTRLRYGTNLGTRELDGLNSIGFGRHTRIVLVMIIYRMLNPISPSTNHYLDMICTCFNFGANCFQTFGYAITKSSQQILV